MIGRVLTAGSMKVRRDSRLELAGTNLLINSVEQEDGGEYDCEVETRIKGLCHQMNNLSERL